MDNTVGLAKDKYAVIDAVFKNLVYSRDLSHKVKSAVETRMKRGVYRAVCLFRIQERPEGHL